MTISFKKEIMTFFLVLVLSALAAGCARQADSEEEQPPAPASEEQTAPGEQTTAELGREWSEAARSLKDYTIEQREEAEEAVTEILRGTDRRIGELQAKLSGQSGELSDEAEEMRRQTLEQVKQQRETLEDWSGKIRESSAEAWSDVKSGFLEAYSELENRLDRAESEEDGEASRS